MKVLYVSTLSNTINRFLIPHIELLLDKGYHVDIACNIDRNIDSTLIDRGCKVFNLEFQRSPFSKQNYIAYNKLKELVKDGKYDLIHTHTPVASACVRFACKKIKKVKVFYTAHGFHFFKGAPIKNWLLYYPIEFFLSRNTDVLITINKEDFCMAKKFLRADRIEYTPGVGIDTNRPNKITIDNFTKRKELGVPFSSLVLLSVGELNKNKNHETIIRAIAELKNPNVYYIICGQGPLKDYLIYLIKKLGLEKQIYLLGYREDIMEICKIADAFIFPSFREGLSVALMEAMASSLPVACSKIRGNTDLIDENGGRLFDPYSIDSCKDAIETLLSQDLTVLGKYNREKVKKFSTHAVLKKLKKIYSEVG